MRTTLILLSSFLLLFQSRSFGQKGEIIKGISHYYLSDNTKITDSMFYTLSHYDTTGKLYKVEEIHYLHGKKNRYFLALYRNENQLLEMYENGKLTLKIEYDSLGSEINQLAVLNSGKDTLLITHFPKYKNGKLSERTSIEKTKAWNEYDVAEETHTYYDYADFPDSSIVTATTKSDLASTTEKTCFTKNKKLLYRELIEKTPASSLVRSLRHTVKYDSSGKKIEILEFIDDVMVAQEKFHYKNDKLASSVLQEQDIVIKTMYENKVD